MLLFLAREFRRLVACRRGRPRPRRRPRRAASVSAAYAVVRLPNRSVGRVRLQRVTHFCSRTSVRIEPQHIFGQRHRWRRARSERWAPSGRSGDGRSAPCPNSTDALAVSTMHRPMSVAIPASETRASGKNGISGSSRRRLRGWPAATRGQRARDPAVRARDSAVRASAPGFANLPRIALLLKHHVDRCWIRNAPP